jgi:hypothetical protein
VFAWCTSFPLIIVVRVKALSRGDKILRGNQAPSTRQH